MKTLFYVLLVILLSFLTISCIQEQTIDETDKGLVGIYDYLDDTRHFQLRLYGNNTFMYRFRYYTTQEWKIYYGTYFITNDINLHLVFDSSYELVYKYKIEDGNLYLTVNNKIYKLKKRKI